MSVTKSLRPEEEVSFIVTKALKESAKTKVIDNVDISKGLLLMAAGHFQALTREMPEPERRLLWIGMIRGAYECALGATTLQTHGPDGGETLHQPERPEPDE